MESELTVAFNNLQSGLSYKPFGKNGCCLAACTDKLLQVTSMRAQNKNNVTLYNIAIILNNLLKQTLFQFKIQNFEIMVKRYNVQTII